MQPFTRRQRKGNVLLLTLFMMVGMLAMLAFAVDLGYLHVVRSQLQRSADSAALAGAWELVDEQAIVGGTDSWQLTDSARTTAGQYAGMNAVLTDSPLLATDDVQVGHMANPSDPNAQMDLLSILPPNAVRVRVRRTSDQNGEAPLFFARVLGFHSTACQAEATAALLNNLGGFQTPSDGGNLDVLPFALDSETWDSLMGGVGQDNWRWDEEERRVLAGADGILEVNLYPQGLGSPGNRGTVDIGGSNNSTNDIARQILHGISPQDLSHHGGKLEFDSSGQLPLNGDTGISAGVKDELATIAGQPRVIPIFASVTGNGNNATYTIVQFAGIRVMEVNLTGNQSSKRVMIQPATVVLRGGIPASSDAVKTHHVYSPVWLIR